ncbi:type 1 glutamine amidotransferase [Candidatus Daviesbacteria bacterium]|nr:type 1 glutamine amidotransferase [Candidatus Daviesbacteria bacterium]
MEFLAFQHVPHEPPGLIADSVRKLGHGLEVVEFWKPNPRIPDIRNYQGLIIMGGPMGVYEGPDKFPSKDAEVETIKKAHEKIPIIGFCLGSQLISYAFGGSVEKNIINGSHVKEVGFYKVELTPEAEEDPILKGFPNPMTVFQWHGDRFSIPEHGVLQATNQYCVNQAFKIGDSTYGFLFHFEFRPDMVNRLIEADRDWMHRDHEVDEAKLMDETRKNEPLMREQCDKLFENFTTLAQKMQR